MSARSLLAVITVAGGAITVFVGVVASQYWILEVIVLTVLALFVAAESTRNADVKPETLIPPPVMRSRIAHYVQMARVKDHERLAEEASNPFEESLLRTEAWPMVETGELAKLSRDIK